MELFSLPFVLHGNTNVSSESSPVKSHRISSFNEKDVGADHKPSSVSPSVTRKALMIIPLGQQLPVASSDATRERRAGRP